MQLGHDRLHHRGQSDSVVHAGLGVADSKLDRVEERMEPDVPPNLFRVIDAVCRNQELQVIFVLGKTFENIGDTGAREALEDVSSIRLEACILAQPER